MIKEKFIEITENITEKQENFIEKINYEMKNDNNREKVNVVPVRCGFGKSLYIKLYLQELVYDKTNLDHFSGAIIVTDSLERLREIKNLKGLEDMCFLLEHIDSEAMLEDTIKKQMNNQRKYPILLVTSQRFFQLDKKTVNNLCKWNNGIRDKVIIDESPNIYNVENIGVQYFADIEEKIDSIHECEIKKRILKRFRCLKKYFEDLSDYFAQDHKDIKWVQPKVFEKFFKEEFDEKEFIKDINKVLTKDIIKKINKIINFCKEGGLFVNRKKFKITNPRFFVYMDNKIENIVNINAKVWIFDATAEYDVIYENDIFNFIDIDSDKTENIEIINVKENYTKTAIMKNRKSKISALKDFISNNICEKEKYMVVSYKEIVEKYFNCEYKGYFGNLKGFNNYRNVKKMFHVGWNRQSDYYYLALYLILNKEERDKLNNMPYRKADALITELISINPKTLQFKNEEINEIALRKIFVDFEQNIYRTSLRKYNSDDKVTIYIFAPEYEFYNELIKIIKNKHGVDVLDTKPVEFLVNSIKDRENKSASIAQLIIDWWLNYDWDGEMKLSDILESIGISNKQFEKAKENNKKLRDFLEAKKSTRKGYYIE